MTVSIKEFYSTSHTDLVSKGEFQPEMNTISNTKFFLNIDTGNGIDTSDTMRPIIVFFGVASKISVKSSSSDNEIGWTSKL